MKEATLTVLLTIEEQDQFGTIFYKYIMKQAIYKGVAPMHVTSTILHISHVYSPYPLSCEILQVHYDNKSNFAKPKGSFLGCHIKALI